MTNLTVISTPTTVRAAPPRRVSEIEFLAWLGQAEPGDVLAYHRGLLAADRVNRRPATTSWSPTAAAKAPSPTL